MPQQKGSLRHWLALALLATLVARFIKNRRAKRATA